MNTLKTILTIAGYSVLFTSCSQTTSMGGSTETSSNVYGYMFTAGGSPAARCAVTLVDAARSVGLSNDPSLTLGTTTDTNGRYEFADIPEVYYNVLSRAGDGSRCLLDSVNVAYDEQAEFRIPDGYLSAPGELQGVVRLEGGGDSRTILIFGIGLPLFAYPRDAGGQFSVDSLAAGSYRIRFLSTDTRYEVHDTTFAVVSGEITTTDTITLKLKPQSDTLEIAGSNVHGTWGPDKVYNVLGDITVPTGERLVILAGTKVIFDGHNGLRADGNLFVLGTESNPVTFTYGPNYAGQGWSRLESSLADTIVLRYAILEKSDGISFSNFYRDPPENVYFEMTNCLVSQATAGLLLKMEVGQHVASINDSMPCDGCIILDSAGTMLESDCANIGRWGVISNNVFSGITGVASDILLEGRTSACHDSIVRVTNNIYVDVASAFGVSTSDGSFVQYTGDYHCFYNVTNLVDPMPNTNHIEPEIGSNVLMADPHFVDAAAGDYHLKPDSPCKGTGEKGADRGILYQQ